VHVVASSWTTASSTIDVVWIVVVTLAATLVAASRKRKDNASRGKRVNLFILPLETKGSNVVVFG
jgi:hypothetical protein